MGAAGVLRSVALVVAGFILGSYAGHFRAVHSPTYLAHHPSVDTAHVREPLCPEPTSDCPVCDDASADNGLEACPETDNDCPICEYTSTEPEACPVCDDMSPEAEASADKDCPICDDTSTGVEACPEADKECPICDDTSTGEEASPACPEADGDCPICGDSSTEVEPCICPIGAAPESEGAPQAAVDGGPNADSSPISLDYWMNPLTSKRENFGVLFRQILKAAGKEKGNFLEIGGGDGEFMNHNMQQFGDVVENYYIIEPRNLFKDNKGKRHKPLDNNLAKWVGKTDTHVEMIEAYSTDKNVISSFKTGYFDFVYIDGDHSYRGAKSDLINFWSKVRLGGVIAGHDYCCKARDMKFPWPTDDKFFVQAPYCGKYIWPYSTADKNKHGFEKDAWCGIYLGAQEFARSKGLVWWQTLEGRYGSDDAGLNNPSYFTIKYSSKDFPGWAGNPGNPNTVKGVNEAKLLALEHRVRPSQQGRPKLKWWLDKPTLQRVSQMSQMSRRPKPSTPSQSSVDPADDHSGGSTFIFPKAVPSRSETKRSSPFLEEEEKRMNDGDSPEWHLSTE